MVWGTFGVNGVLELKKINHTIDSIGYQKILKSSLKNVIFNIIEDKKEKIFFHQNNCSINKSKSTTYFLKKQKKYLLLCWP